MNRFFDRILIFYIDPISDKLNNFHRLWRLAVTATWMKAIFRSVGEGSVIFKPGFVSGGDCISIGNRTVIRYGARLEVVRHGQPWKPTLLIGSGVNIEQNVHIVCHDRVVIGDNVSITGNCAIVDVSHPHSVVLTGGKVGSAIDESRSFVEIGHGAFIGFGSTILPNVKLGCHCVIGAGSVVANDVPDYAVAAGVPARVISVLKKDR